MPGFDEIAKATIPNLNEERAMKVLLQMREENPDGPARLCIVGPGESEDKRIIYYLGTDGSNRDMLRQVPIEHKDPDQSFPINLAEPLKARQIHLDIWKKEKSSSTQRAEVRRGRKHRLLPAEEKQVAAAANQVAIEVLERRGEAFGDRTPEVNAIRNGKQPKQSLSRYRNYPGLKQAEFPDYNMNTIDDLCPHIILAEGPKDKESFDRLCKNIPEDKDVAFLALGEPREFDSRRGGLVSKYFAYAEYPKQLTPNIKRGKVGETEYRQVPNWQDMETLKFSDDEVKDLYAWLDDTSTNKVIHCSAGLGRSGTLALAYVMVKKYGDQLLTMTPEQLGLATAETLQSMRARRPGLVQQPEQLEMAIQLARRFASLRPEARLTETAAGSISRRRAAPRPSPAMPRAAVTASHTIKEQIQQDLQTMYDILDCVDEGKGAEVKKAKNEQAQRLGQCLYYLENPSMASPEKYDKIFHERNIGRLQLEASDKEAFTNALRRISDHLDSEKPQPISIKTNDLDRSVSNEKLKLRVDIARLEEKEEIAQAPASTTRPSGR